MPDTVEINKCSLGQHYELAAERHHKYVPAPADAPAPPAAAIGVREEAGMGAAAEDRASTRALATTVASLHYMKESIYIEAGTTAAEATTMASLHYMKERYSRRSKDNSSRGQM